MAGESLEANFKKVSVGIAEAAVKSGRKSSDVKLLAVSKKQADEKIQQAIRIGQKDFGENYVQELVPRLEKFPQANWHYIGNLQSNKCKFIVGKVALIHSVDRESLAGEINKIAERLGTVQDVLLQINLGNEEMKGGVNPQDAKSLLTKLRLMANIRVLGLMALPPHSENAEHSRKYFKQLKQFADEFSLSELSIGTSQDYEVAVEEGATIVRVGTSLFGERI